MSHQEASRAGAHANGGGNKAFKKGLERKLGND